jgi:hypothetical protein
MLSYLDCLIIFIVGGLFINPRRYRNIYRAMLAACLCGAATTAAYLLITRVLDDQVKALVAWATGVFS